MFKFLTILIITTLLFTGCSTPTPESKPKYDQKELNAYNRCLANSDIDGNTAKKLTDSDLERCKHLKPIKK